MQRLTLQPLDVTRQGLTLQLRDVVVRDAKNLHGVNVQMWLDDTCNPDGSSNTLLVQGTAAEHGKGGDGHFHLGPHTWAMCGSTHGTKGPWKMPDVVKIAVTAELLNPAGGGEVQHGLAGAATIPLEDLLSSDSTAVEVCNCFTGDKVTAVELHLVGAAKALEDFRLRRQELFKPSELPKYAQAQALCAPFTQNLLGSLYGLVQQNKLQVPGVTNLQLSAPAAVEHMARECGQFYEGSSVFARVPNVPIPLVAMALPGMHNHHEQPLLMDKRVLFFGFHDALKVFEPHKYGPLTLLRNLRAMHAGKASANLVEETLAFCVTFLNGLQGMHTKYKYDAWIVRDAAAGGYSYTQEAEDYQLPLSSRPSWSAKYGWQPSTGGNDCESSTHAVVAMKQAADELCGQQQRGRPLGKMDMLEVVRRVDEQVFNFRDGLQFDQGNHNAFKLPEATTMLFPEFADLVLGQEGSLSDRDKYRFGLAAAVAFVSNLCPPRQKNRRTVVAGASIAGAPAEGGGIPGFFMDVALGSAYGASAGDARDNKKERQQGGHCYAVMGLKDSQGRVLHSCISEQTVFVLPRIHAENKVQLRQVLAVEVALCQVVFDVLRKAGARVQEIVPVMQSAVKEHTGDFYNRVHVLSHVTSYDDMVNGGQPYGSYPMAKDPDTQTLSLGVEPEHAYNPKTTSTIEFCGHSCDAGIAKAGFEGFDFSDMAGDAAEAFRKTPFSSSMRQVAKARRELGPRVVSAQEWGEFIHRVWSTNFIASGSASSGSAVGYHEIGRLARGLLLGKDVPEAQRAARVLREQLGTLEQLQEACAWSMNHNPDTEGPQTQALPVLQRALREGKVEDFRVTLTNTACVLLTLKTREGHSFSAPHETKSHFAVCPLILAKMHEDPLIFKLQPAAADPKGPFEQYCASTLQRPIDRHAVHASRRYCFGPISKELGTFAETDIWMHLDACRTCVFGTAADEVAGILHAAALESGPDRLLVCDATPGMGEMAYAFSKKFASVQVLLPDEKLQRLFLEHNLGVLGCKNVTTASGAPSGAVAFYNMRGQQQQVQVQAPAAYRAVAVAVPISSSSTTTVPGRRLRARHSIYLNFAHIFDVCVFV